jgi:amino acid transporter
LTAWLNLIGLITVLAAINVGTFNFFVGSFGSFVGIEAGYWSQLLFLIVMTGVQALINHLGIKATTKLTDLSGYLILAGAVLLTVALFAYAPTRDFSRLWTFTNYSGAVGGDVWPATSSMMLIFFLGLLLPIYTLSGYDASAHTSEETVGAAKKVPTAIIHSVFWAALFAWIFSCAFVLAIPDMNEAAKQGWNVFFYVMDATIPPGLKYFLYAIISVAQFICGLATVTSASRMTFAFARDNGLPGSRYLKTISPKYRTPVHAIWTSAALAVGFTSFAGAYSVAVAVTSIALYLSYAMPIAAGLFAYGKSWKQMGPWDMGPSFRIVAVLCIGIAGVIFYVGVQPPNDFSLKVLGGIAVLTILAWFGIENKRFKGPPIGDRIAARAAEIAAAEAAVGEA